jgi:hypothetical protein
MTVTEVTAPHVPYLTVVGPAIKVSVNGAGGQLETPATLTFPVPAAAVLDGASPVVVWQNGHGGWRALPTTYHAGAATLQAQTDHFSIGFLAVFDTGSFVKTATTDALNYIQGRSGATQPTCPADSPAVPVRVVFHGGGNSTYGCVGGQDGHPLVTITNNTRAYTEITYPQTWTVTDGGSGSFSEAGAERLIGTDLDDAVAPRGFTTRLLSGGGTLTVEGPVGAGGVVSSEMSIDAWYVSAIDLGVNVYFNVLRAITDDEEAQAAEATEAAFHAEGSDAPPSATVRDFNDAVTDCGRAVTSEITNDQYFNPVTAAGARSITKAVFECIPGLAKAGIAQVQSSFVKKTLTSLVTEVTVALTALNLAIAGTRYVYDSFASFGGKSDPDWVIELLAAPVLGSLAFLANATGYGLVAPPVIDNGGDGNGVVTAITWSNWGQATATGAGTASYAAPGQVLAYAKSLPATVVAFNLGDCGGVLAYRDLEWYFPEEGESFSVSAGGDVCDPLTAGDAPATAPATLSISGFLGITPGEKLAAAARSVGQTPQITCGAAFTVDGVLVESDSAGPSDGSTVGDIMVDSEDQMGPYGLAVGMPASDIPAHLPKNTLVGHSVGDTDSTYWVIPQPNGWALWVRADKPTTTSPAGPLNMMGLAVNVATAELYGYRDGGC